MIQPDVLSLYQDVVFAFERARVGSPSRRIETTRALQKALVQARVLIAVTDELPCPRPVWSAILKVLEVWALASEHDRAGRIGDLAYSCVSALVGYRADLDPVSVGEAAKR